MVIPACWRVEQNQTEKRSGAWRRQRRLRCLPPSHILNKQFYFLTHRLGPYLFTGDEGCSADREERQETTEVGDWVRVVKGAWTAKGESKFSEPLEVRKVYKYAVLLSDGNVWNRGKVIKVPVWCSQAKLFNMGNKLGNNVDDDTSASEPPLNKSEHEGVKVRDKSELRRPMRFDDYVEQ
ncbi:hypothetical protein NDU88_009271 [Pleurodeles waltl]|uniref:Uncharacterized protein n=1 Tax=Pleurodeles waltl TaxID=8319 RepID=A0AAV7PUG3_PLEWA|nr:hypothetical protein NDU88_009271 [Pleurodeles waltl]